MKKRNLVWILLLAVLFLSSPLFAQAKSEAKPEGPIKIVYWRSLTGVAGESQDEVVRRFNASRNDIIVEAEFVSVGEVDPGR